MLPEHLDATDHFLRQGKVHGLVSGPEACREDADAEFETRVILRVVVEVSLKCCLSFPGELKILKHPFHPTSELCTALCLELGQYETLVIIIGAFVVKQAPGEALTMKFPE